MTDSFVLKCLYETYYDHDNSCISRNGLRCHKRKLVLITPIEIVMGGYKCFANSDMEGLGKIYHKENLIKVNGDHQLAGAFANCYRIY